MFKLAKNSLAFADGHSDELSRQSCHILLGCPEDYQLMEIIYADEAVFNARCVFILGGAHYRNITLNGVTIEQNRVYEAAANDVLKFFGLQRGFRLYLMARPFEQSLIGRRRGRFSDSFSPVPRKIRVLKGPEFNYLDAPEEFLQRPFVISANSDLGGIRLEGAKIQAQRYDITSAIVDDGMIQLTANGPIVLLRQRQLTGGYPRIFSVIKTDLDFLAQYRTGGVVRFELIELAQAQALLRHRERQLKNFPGAVQGAD